MTDPDRKGIEGWVRLGIFVLGAMAGAIAVHYHDMSAHVEPMNIKIDAVVKEFHAGTLEFREVNTRLKMLHPELFQTLPADGGDIP